MALFRWRRDISITTIHHEFRWQNVIRRFPPHDKQHFVACGDDWFFIIVTVGNVTQEYRRAACVIIYLHKGCDVRAGDGSVYLDPIGYAVDRAPAVQFHHRHGIKDFVIGLVKVTRSVDE